MNIVTRPGFTQTLEQARREREKARMKAVADLAQRREGREESIARLNQHFQATRRGRWRPDMRGYAREVAERVFGNLDEEGLE